MSENLIWFLKGSLKLTATLIVIAFVGFWITVIQNNHNRNELNIMVVEMEFDTNMTILEGQINGRLRVPAGRPQQVAPPPRVPNSNGRYPYGI